MNEPETQSEMTQDFALEDLREEVQSLRTLMSVSLMVLIIFSCCVNWYIYRQASMARTQTKQLTQTATMMQQRAAEIWTALVKYGATHPEFNSTVLEKYRPYFVAGPTPPGAAAPAPAPAKAK